MKKGEDMAEVVTYECRKCGCEIIVSGADESYLRPIYCCGTEVARISPSRQTVARKIKRKTSAKAPVKASSSKEGKTVKKAMVRRKGSGG